MKTDERKILWEIKMIRYEHSTHISVPHIADEDTIKKMIKSLRSLLNERETQPKS